MILPSVSKVSVIQEAFLILVFLETHFCLSQGYYMLLFFIEELLRDFILQVSTIRYLLWGLQRRRDIRPTRPQHLECAQSETWVYPEIHGPPGGGDVA